MPEEPLPPLLGGLFPRLLPLGLPVVDDSYLRVGSTIAFAPSDEAGIAMILIVDEPTSQIKYGSYVAAPYVSTFLAKALPYLGFKAANANELFSVGNYVGMNPASVCAELKEAGVACETIGKGSVVLSQVPPAGDELIAESANILLYTEENGTEYVVVPDLIGKEALAANLAVYEAGLNLMIEGVRENNAGAEIVAQSPAAGSVVARASTLTLTVRYTDFED